MAEVWFPPEQKNQEGVSRMLWGVRQHYQVSGSPMCPQHGAPEGRKYPQIPMAQVKT